METSGIQDPARATPSPSSYQLPIVSHLGVGFYAHLPTPCEMLSGLIFHMACVRCYAAFEFIYTTVLLCP